MELFVHSNNIENKLFISTSRLFCNRK